ncbi:MAG: TolC family protein [Myxococcota bacterium]
MSSGLVAVLVVVAGSPVSLSLSDAQRLAAERSPALAARRALRDGADHRLTASTSRLLPRLSLGVRYSRLSYVAPGQISLPFSLPNQPPPEPIQLGEAIENAFASSVVLEQPLFTGLSLLNQREASKRSLVAAERQLEQERQDLALRVEEAWLGLVRARQLAGVAQQSEQVLGAHLERLERMADAGAITSLEVTRTRARLAAVRVQVLQARAAEAVARLGLVTLLGLDPDAEPTCELPADDEPAMAPGQEGVRPELIAAREVAASKEAQARALAGGLWPQLLARASVQFDSPNTRYFPLRNEFNPSWEASAILSWTAWDWGATWHTHRAAALEAEAARHSAAQLEEAARIDVARRRVDFDTAASKLEATRAAVDAAALSLQRAQRQCEAGQLACITVLDAEAELSRLQADLVQARIDRRLAVSQLRRATGTLSAPELP